jgi:hypothetical protein
MNIRKIYIDLDGVSNQLIMHALEVNGCKVSRFHDDQWPTPGSYDIVAAANKLLGPRRGTLTHAQFWGNVTRDVWAGTPASAEFYYILRAAVDAAGRGNVCFLTSPIIESPDCSAGKHEWFRRHLPLNMARQFSICPYKKIHASPDALLVDDSDAEVDSWRARGGQALLVPRPWNSRYAENSEQALFEYFAQFPQSSFPQLRTVGLIPAQPN